MRLMALPRSSRTLSPSLFEALEPRSLLSAPTAVLDSTTVNSDSLIVTVHYASTAPIDLTSLGNDDLSATGAHGYAKPGRMFLTANAQDPQHVTATYRFDAPGPIWDWLSNGNFQVRLNAGTVRNTAGETNAAALLASYWLWFASPHVEFGSQQVDQTRQVWAISAHATSALGIGPFAPVAYVHVTGPNGYDFTTLLATPYSNEPVNDTLASVTIPAPGGAWDFRDSGHYTLTMGQIQWPIADVLVHLPAFYTASYNLTFSAPHAEVATSTIAGRSWTVTMNYSAPSGINSSTIGSGDLLASGPGFTNLPGTLTQPPTRHSDGSVTAIYRFTSPSSGGWNYHNNGAASVSLNINAVRANNGNPVPAATYLTQELSFPAPQFSSIRSLSDSATGWDVEVTFNNTGGLIDTSSLRDGNIEVSGGGINMHTSLVSFTTSGDLLRARYHITPLEAPRFPNGTYSIFLSSLNPVTYEQTPIAAGFLGSWYLWHA